MQRQGLVPTGAHVGPHTMPDSQRPPAHPGPRRRCAGCTGPQPPGLCLPSAPHLQHELTVIPPHEDELSGQPVPRAAAAHQEPGGDTHLGTGQARLALQGKESSEWGFLLPGLGPRVWRSRTDPAPPRFKHLHAPPQWLFPGAPGSSHGRSPVLPSVCLCPVSPTPGEGCLVLPCAPDPTCSLLSLLGARG